MHRIFSNIRANIAQYASSEPPVTIALSGDGGYLAVRIDSVTSPHGTGLGLTICEDLMRNMGSGFSAQSQEDRFDYLPLFRMESPVHSSD